MQVENEAANSQMLLGCLLFLVQDSAALEEAELRQSDGYSENSARNSGHIFHAGGQLSPCLHPAFVLLLLLFVFVLF